jgi:hypothetical protein
MEKPIITSFNSLATMFIQKYERYLPTAFDESMSLLEKVNKVIVYLNQIGELTNNVVDQWNTVMEWILADGINEKVAERLDQMVADGTMATIINEDIFNSLNTTISTLDTTLNGKITTLETETDTSITTINSSIEAINTDIGNVEASVSTTNTNVSYLGKNVKTLGAKGDYVDTNQRGTNDTTIFQNALQNGGIIFIPDGNYYITDVLLVKSNTRLIFSPKATLHTYSEKAFSFESGVENVRIEQPKLINHYAGTSYAFYMNGNASGGYATSVKEIVIVQGYAEGYTWSFYFNALRKSTITDFHGYCKNGFIYTGKSAENVIENSNFINFDEVNMVGTKGLYSLANADGYPEGLSIKNTLFYHYEKNIYISDLYVGKFTDLYLDAGLVSCLDSFIEWNTRTEFLSFTDTWSLYRGFVLGGIGYSSPKELRSKFTNTIFDGLKGEGFHLNQWVRDIELNNTSVYGDGAYQAIGIVSLGQNNFLKVNGYRGRFMLSNIQIKGAGQYVELYNISNFDTITVLLHIFCEQAITVNGQAFPANG